MRRLKVCNREVNSRLHDGFSACGHRIFYGVPSETTHASYTINCDAASGRKSNGRVV